MLTDTYIFVLNYDIAYLNWDHSNSYEPEIFPGLIYRMFQPKVVLLVFVSGKVVLTGKWQILFIFLFFC